MHAWICCKRENKARTTTTKSRKLPSFGTRAPQNAEILSPFISKALFHMLQWAKSSWTVEGQGDPNANRDSSGEGADVKNHRFPNILNVMTKGKCQETWAKGRVATIYEELIKTNKKKNQESNICEQRTWKDHWHTKKLEYSSWHSLSVYPMTSTALRVLHLI